MKLSCHGGDAINWSPPTFKTSTPRPQFKIRSYVCNRFKEPLPRLLSLCFTVRALLLTPPNGSATLKLRHTRH